MEAERRLSSSLKRKPLSDCSNVAAVTSRNPPSLAAKSATTVINKSKNAAITASISHKSYTSTGSNVSPDVSSFLSDPPPPPTPLFDFDNIPDGRDRKKLENLAAQSQRQDTKATKDTSKMVLDIPIAEASHTSTPWTPELMPSAASDNCHQSMPPIIQSKSIDAQARNDKEKMVLSAYYIKACEPITPHVARMITSSSARGIHNQQRSNLMVKNQRRSQQRRKHADGKALLPLSSPPGKRTKKKGYSNRVKRDDSGVKKQFGSLADPLPLHEKAVILDDIRNSFLLYRMHLRKRSGNKQNDAIHGMPQEEIERLRTYYADVDAFELPEEVAPEMDLD